MAALNLSQLIRELQDIDANIRARANMPAYMDIILPCRATTGFPGIKFDVVKITARLGDSVLLHLYRED